MKILIGTIGNFVYGGLWNILEVILAAAWLPGTGFLPRSERRFLAIVTMLVGISSLVDALGVILCIDILARLGLLLFTGLTPVWALWLGIGLLR